MTGCGCLGVVLQLSIAATVLHGAGASPLPQPSSPRQRVFISDLHMGVGRQPDGRWNNLEDFRWAREFRAFLDEIDRNGNGATDLVIVGDAFELWQSTLDDCIYANKDFGCTEADAVERMRRVVASHQEELTAIGAFAKKGTNRVVFVPGNHDAALLFTRVGDMAVQATGATAAVAVSQSGAWVSPDGAIYAEHGHQIGKEVNKFDGWPRPFVGTPVHLQRPWGEQFVQQYYNRFEAKYPILDNILAEGVGVHYAIRAEGLIGAAADIGRYVGFFVTKLSWAQYGGVLKGDRQPPEWNFEAIRRGGNQFFVDSLAPDDPLRPAAERAARDATLGISIADLTDDDIRAICDARAALNAPEPRVQLVSKPPRCPVKELGALSQALLRRSRDAILREHFQLRSRELGDTQPNAAQFRLYVYGHTHVAEDGFTPMQGTLSDWRPMAINTGAWQRVIEPVDLERWRGTRPAAAVLTALPEELPPCYSVVVVGPYQANPSARLRYWTEQDGEWRFADSCGWSPPQPR